MAVFYMLVVGMTIWIGAWAFGVKAIDSFMVMAALMLGAAAYQMAKPYVLRQLGRE